MGKYDDIIYLKHHQSNNRPHMSIHDRAAQFAPFAALTGYMEEVEETARVTDDKIQLDDNEIALINQTLQYISDNINENIELIITHFVPDKHKEGGAYVDKLCSIKKIDEINKTICLYDDEIIKLDNVISISFIGNGGINE